MWAAALCEPSAALKYDDEIQILTSGFVLIM